MDVDTLYRTLRRYVVAVARAHGCPPSDLEDIAHDVFAVALARRDALRDPTQTRAWIRGVTVRTARAAARRRRVDPARLASLALDLSDEGDVSGDLERARAAQALDDMPAPLRDAWRRRVADGEALADIAAAQGCSLATVKRRLRDATARLRDALSAGCDEARTSWRVAEGRVMQP